MLYDAFLLFALMMLATLPFIAARGGEMVEPDDNAVLQLVLFLVIFAYFVGYWAWKGRTLGMQSWGLQLETAEQRVPGFRACTLRFFASLLSWAPLGLGFFWQLWDRDRRTWHDRLSRTFLSYYPRRKH
jgi:uncharacterized RDD family membrane protein YckC